MKTDFEKRLDQDEAEWLSARERTRLWRDILLLVSIMALTFWIVYWITK